MAHDIFALHHITRLADNELLPLRIVADEDLVAG